MAPYDALYGCRFRYVVGLFKVGEAYLIGLYSVDDSMEKVKLLCHRLKTIRVAKYVFCRCKAKGTRARS